MLFLMLEHFPALFASSREVRPDRYRHFILVDFYGYLRCPQLFIRHKLHLKLVTLLVQARLSQVFLDLVVIHTIRSQLHLYPLYFLPFFPQQLTYRPLFLDNFFLGEPRMILILLGVSSLASSSCHTLSR